MRGTLQAVAARGAVTHETLDALPPGRTLVHLRSMLVAAGAIPAPDERLTALEAWISQCGCRILMPLGDIRGGCRQRGHAA